MIKVKCVIVAYNKEIANCNNIRLLNTNEINTEFIICDNSESNEMKISNYRFCEKKNFKDSDMKGNKGLSRAYNEVIKLLDNDDWMVIFDQDTDVPQDYFANLEESINTYPTVNIHVPIVKSIRAQMSPSQLKKNSVRRIKHTVPGSYTNITAINSGMAIRGEVFYVVGNYNEKI
jgi:GT2 family glycosyltransferase